MRILLVNKFHYLKGGAERAYFDTARILAEKGHEVIFFAMEHPQNQETKWSKYFPREVDYLKGGLSLKEKIHSGLSLLWNREAQKKLEALLQEAKPDVAHLHNIYHQLSPSIIWTLKKHGIPIVMTLHDYKLISPNYSLFLRGKIWNSGSGLKAIFSRAVKNSFVKSALCAKEKWLHAFLGSYRKVDTFIAPSRFLIEKYQELGAPYQIEYVAQPLLPFPDELSTTEEKDYFLFFGRLSEEKGIMTLLQAFKTLPQEKLLIAGTGPEEEPLKRYAREQGLSHVEFVGVKQGDELKKLICEAKAVIIPSVWYENMPYVLLESLGEGKVVIASRIGGIPERIVDGQNGFLFEAGNAPDLARVITGLRGKNLTTLKEAAKKSIEDLRPETYGTNIERIYQRLVQS